MIYLIKEDRKHEEARRTSYEREEKWIYLQCAEEVMEVCDTLEDLLHYKTRREILNMYLCMVTQ